MNEQFKGMEVSIDMSTGDDSSHHRIFAKLTGEVNDGVLLAELDHANYTIGGWKSIELYEPEDLVIFYIPMTVGSINPELHLGRVGDYNGTHLIIEDVYGDDTGFTLEDATHFMELPSRP